MVAILEANPVTKQPAPVVVECGGIGSYVDSEWWNSPCLKLTAKAPENGRLEDEMSFWGPAYFQGLDSGRVIPIPSMYGIFTYVYLPTFSWFLW